LPLQGGLPPVDGVAGGRRRIVAVLSHHALMPRCARDGATLAALRALVMGDVQSSDLWWLGIQASGL
jgi:hypothetical protein